MPPSMKAASVSRSSIAWPTRNPERCAICAGAGVGLANVERRLQAVFGKRASLEAVRENGRFVATICIPEIQQAN
jgi:sensor histidine kinase YesM